MCAEHRVHPKLQSQGDLGFESMVSTVLFLMGVGRSVGNVWIFFPFLTLLIDLLLYHQLLSTGNKKLQVCNFECFQNERCAATLGTLLGVLSADAGTGCTVGVEAIFLSGLIQEQPVWKSLIQGQATVCL